MPAVVVDSSVLITLAAGEQFHLLRELYGTLFVPVEVWNEVTFVAKPFGTREAKHARDDGWLIIRNPTSLDAVRALPFNLQPGETQALALAVELPDSLLLVDDAQGRRAAQALGIRYTGTLGVLLRAKAEGKLPALFPVLTLMQQRTTFWLADGVRKAALAQAGETGQTQYVLVETESRLGEIGFIPVIVQLYSWKQYVGAIQRLPGGGKPVADWKSFDKACYDVEQVLRRAITEVRKLLGTSLYGEAME